MRRSTPFGDIVKHLVPFFVSRQVICGAGRVGIGQDGHGAGFQLSQRADSLRGRGRPRDHAEATHHQHP
jgi:proteasome accessory factor A